MSREAQSRGAGRSLLNASISHCPPMRDRTRIRARLDRNCPALDYYYGFYISPDEDGLVCADRDSIRSRVGGECQIDAFRRLRPEKRD